MKFLIIAFDGKDDDALNRRLAVREKHFKLGDQMIADGHFWYGGAILDDAGKMIGSMMVMDFPSKDELDKWLEIEPYVVGQVWKDIKIHNFNVSDPAKFNR